MADVKISALTAATSVAAADQFVIVQGGTTKVADGTMAMARTGALTAAAASFTSLTTTATASIAASAAAIFGVHGAATAQLTAITTALTTGVATGLVGFASTAQLQATVDAVNACIAVLQKNGFTA